MEKSSTGRNSPMMLKIARSQLVLPTISSPRKSEQKLSPRMLVKRLDTRKLRDNGWKTDRSALSPTLPSLSGQTLSLLLQHSQPGFTRAGLPHTNQDALFLHQRENCYILGVCDGHGTWGHEVAQKLAQVLPEELFVRLEGRSQSEVKKTMEMAVKHAASEVEAIDIDMSCSGCTCTCVLVLNRAIYCANVGDSRAVLGRKSCGIWSVCHLSWDHKPEDPAERQRIQDCGGEVTAGRLGTMRVYVKNEGFPGLAMSRSVGDLVATAIGVTADPDVSFLRISPTDKFLLIASDGLWDVVPSIEAVALVGAYLDQGQPGKSLAGLVHLAQSRWLKRGRADDISVIVAFISA